MEKKIKHSEPNIWVPNRAWILSKNTLQVFDTKMYKKRENASPP